MPFTFSHTVLIIPFAKYFKRFINPAGFIIGTMSCDFEYFINTNMQSVFGHSFIGIFLYCLPLSVVIYFLFEFIIKKPLLENLSSSISSVFTKYYNDKKQYNLIFFIILVLSIITGALTHLSWDSFTHETGFFVNQIPFLQQEINLLIIKLKVFKVIQHLSSLIGIFLICLFIYYKNKVKGIIRIKNNSKINKILFWLSIIILSLVIGFLKMLYNNFYDIWDYVISLMTGFFVSLIIVTLFIKIKEKLISYN